jgi:hypothetical protein
MAANILGHAPRSTNPAVEATGLHGKRPRRFYDAPTHIAPVEGVVVKRREEEVDEYIGTAVQLAASGLLPLELFPGAPGMPSNSVSLNPRGCTRAKYRAPGHMEVFRAFGGKFRIVLGISEEERKRRHAAGLAREKRARQLKEEAAAAAEQRAREWTRQLPIPTGRVFDLLHAAGYRQIECYEDSAKLSSYSGCSRQEADAAIVTLRLLELAEIERKMVRMECQWARLEAEQIISKASRQ